MKLRRMTRLAVQLGVVLAIVAGVAKAQEKVRIAVPSTNKVSTRSDFVALTGVVNGTRDFTSGCMSALGFADDHPVINAVVVDTSVPPAAKVVDYFVLETSLKPGTRLVDLALVNTCNDGGVEYNVYETTIALPQSFNVAFVIAPPGVSLTEDHEGIVGAATGEFGTAEAVCVKKGAPSLKAELLSDIPLEPGDRLTDFLAVDFDPLTGETMYACWVEY